jgi:hypothetical protein
MGENDNAVEERRLKEHLKAIQGISAFTNSTPKFIKFSPNDRINFKFESGTSRWMAVNKLIVDDQLFLRIYEL